MSPQPKTNRKARFRVVRPAWATGLICALVIHHAIALNAATRTWLGAVDRNWNNPKNWVDGLVPVLGDSLVFPEDVIVRDTFNNLAAEVSIKNITIEGRNYILRGQKLDLTGDITSIPSNSHTRILLDLNVFAPITIANEGYFNQLEIGGSLTLNFHPLTFTTISDILLTGTITDTNNWGTTFRSASNGRLTLGDNAVIGTMLVDHGIVILPDSITGGRLAGVNRPTLIIGNDTNAIQSAEVRVEHGERIGDTMNVIVNRSGLLNLAAADYPEGIVETIGGLSGSGIVDLGPGRLVVKPDGIDSAFSGEIRGTGTFQFAGDTNRIELSGNSILEGSIDVQSGELRLTGTASNAIVTLQAGSLLRGNGIARNLNSTAATVEPGPGTLRFLESCTLDAASRLKITLDGPDAARLQTGTIDLGGAMLEPTYQGTDSETRFTLISADQTGAASVFKGLSEGGWLVAGDPAAPSDFQMTYVGNGARDVVLERAGLFVPPLLDIHRYSETEHVIEWPGSAHGYTLQQTSAIGQEAWTTNDLPLPTITETGYTVIQSSAAPGGRFYRLIR